VGSYSDNMQMLTAQKADSYKKALQNIVNHLGPQILDCKEQHCEGCKMEAHEALRIAKEALE
jgi:hypothetical protein